MQCTLLIPRLFWPRETAERVSSGLHLPALTTLLGRSRRERFAAIATEGWLCQAFQVERQQDWPVAPLTLAIDGGETGEAYWLRADPVHLRVDRNRLLLIENTLFDVTADEAHALVSSLNEHFASEGLSFHAPSPKRWYARLSRAPNLFTHCTSEVAGQDVQLFLPAGSDALAWHRVFNEIQMLLHTNAANAAREARAEPVVNSVWFWGGGARTAVPGSPYSVVWSDDTLAVSLAALADARTADCPANAGAWFNSPHFSAGDEGAHLIVIDELAAPNAHHDSQEWRARVVSLEESWFAPLLGALRESKLTGIALVTPGAAGCWRFDLTKMDLLKFWRRPLPWAEYG
jgi:hypothetical protein